MNLDFLEQQVFMLHQAGHSIRAIANHLGIDKSKVQRIIGKIHKGTLDTVNDTILSSQGETCDTDNVSLTDTLANRKLDTLHDTVPMAISADIPQGRCSLDGIGLLTRQIGILKEDINDFVSDTSWLNLGGVSIIYTSYQVYLRRVRRLIQSIILLTDQLGVDYRSLLVTHVLKSIQVAIEEDFSEYPVPELPDDSDSVCIPLRNTEPWTALLKVDFLHPSQK